jgi:hypothetical protein
LITRFLLWTGRACDFEAGLAEARTQSLWYLAGYGGGSLRLSRRAALCRGRPKDEAAPRQGRLWLAFNVDLNTARLAAGISV